MKKVHRIKKYKNRLMYDTATSKMITLKQLAEMLQEGSDVRIEDNDSGEDITRLAILQMLTEMEKSGKSLRNIVPDIVATILDLPQIDLVKVLTDLIRKNKNDSDLRRVWARKVVRETSLGSMIPVNMERKIVAEIANQLEDLYRTILAAMEDAVKDRSSIYEIYDNILKAMEKALEESEITAEKTAAVKPVRRKTVRGKSAAVKAVKKERR